MLQQLDSPNTTSLRSGQLPQRRTACDEPYELSVIIPTHDHRIKAGYIGSWTKKQTCAAGRFEVIVVTDGQCPEYEAEVRKLLRPQDRLVRCDLPEQNRMHRYQLGARLAQGRTLLFTEDHCIGHVSCVDEVLDFLGRTGCDGAMVGVKHCSTGELGRFEQREYDEQVPKWTADRHWDKVRLRGFALDREKFLKVGGFEPEYGLVAEALLSVALHESGCSIGYAERARVSHVNQSRISSLVDDVYDYASGECRYRAAHTGAALERYMDTTTEWSNRQALQSQLARWHCLAVLRTLWTDVVRGSTPGRWQAWCSLGRALAVRAPLALLGTHGPAWLAWLKLFALKTQWRLGWGAGEQRFELFRNLWSGAARWARLDTMARLGPVDDLIDAPTQSIDIHQIPDAQLIGFFGRETWQGRPFRWSSDVATVRWQVAPGHYEIELDTAGIRGENVNLPLGVFWNRCKISSGDLRRERGLLTFSITPEMFVAGAEQRLTMICTPLPLTGAEIRRLGLPLFGLRLRSAPQYSGSQGSASVSWGKFPTCQV